MQGPLSASEDVSRRPVPPHPEFALCAAIPTSPRKPGRGEASNSQRLQILDQIVALLLLELAADGAVLAGARRAIERVAGIAVAVDRCAVGRSRRKALLPCVAALGLLGIYAKTDLLRIVVAPAPMQNYLRTLGRGAQHPVERGHRAVVKVRRGGPDTVQRARAIRGGSFCRPAGTGIRTVLALAPPFVALLPWRTLIVHPFRLTMSTSSIKASE